VAEASATVDIAASPARLMAVITDFSRYPEFLPEMEEAVVIRREGAVQVVRFAIRLVRRIEYTLELRQVDDLHVEWHLVEGNFRANDGGWDLEPLEGGASTRAHYRVAIDLGMFVPGSVMKTLVEKSLPATLAAFKARAEATP
jgi:ribosome-associated toxin RatA of RatAB toxin-antitoxin module